MASWGRPEKLALLTLLVAASGVLAAWLVVPEVRRVLGLSEDGGSESEAISEREAENVFLKVTSNLAAAEIFLDWEFQGRTPGKVPRQPGLLVVTKPGYLAEYRRLETLTEDSIFLTLRRDTSVSARGAFIRLDIELVGELLSDLKTVLQDVGLVPRFAPVELRRSINVAGSSSDPAILAWTRSKYRVRYLFDIRVQRQIRELDRQGISDPNLRGALEGVYKADVTIEADVIDVRCQEMLGRVVATGTGSGLDEDAAWRRAVSALMPSFSERLSQFQFIPSG